MEMNDEMEDGVGGYFGIDLRTLLIFGGLVLGVVVVVTGIYVAIFGFGNWKSSMQQAGSMMLANVDVPVAGAGVPLPMPLAPGAVVAAPGAPVAGAQFSCPTCGAVGLPLWNQTGTPMCPTCGGLMSVAGAQGGATRLAAAP